MRSLPLILMALSGAVTIAQNQRIARSALEINTFKMVVSLQMDRAVYFPGEDANIEITVHNPTNEVLVIAEPFRTSPLVLVQLSSLVEEIDWNTPGIRPTGFVSHPPRAVDAVPFSIQPGATLRQRKKIYSKDCFESPWMVPCFTPVDAGTYGWVYNYGRGARAKYTVAIPELVEFTETRLRTPGTPQPRFEPNTGKPEAPFLPQLYTRAVIVETKDGARFVLVGRRAGGWSDEYIQKGKFEGQNVAALMAPLFRLVEGDRTLESLRIVETDENDVCMVHVSQKGEVKAMRIDALKGQALTK